MRFRPNKHATGDAAARKDASFTRRKEETPSPINVDVVKSTYDTILGSFQNMHVNKQCTKETYAEFAVAYKKYSDHYIYAGCKKTPLSNYPLLTFDDLASLMVSLTMQQAFKDKQSVALSTIEEMFEKEAENIDNYCLKIPGKRAEQMKRLFKEFTSIKTAWNWVTASFKENEDLVLNGTQQTELSEIIDLLLESYSR